MYYKIIRNSLVLTCVLFFPLTTAAELIKVQAPASTGYQYDPMARPNGSGVAGLYVEQAGSAADGGGQAAVSAQGSIVVQSVSNPVFMRWPSGGRPAKPMESSEAFYRDAFIGVRYVATATADGDEWVVKAVYPVEDSSPDTQTTEWLPLRFYEQVGDAYNCFYAPGWLYYICGSTSITVTAYKLSQCEPAGQWQMIIEENGATQWFGFFTLRLELPEEDLKAPIAQTSGSPHSYDSLCFIGGNELNKAYCDPKQPLPADYTQFTIGAKGCAMTATAMVGEYHNATIGAGQGLIDMNDWLVDNDGFEHKFVENKHGNVIWSKLAQYARLKGAAVYFLNFGDADDVQLRNDICRYGPQALSVDGGGHFVMAVGRDGLHAGTPWKIYDPAGGVISNLRDARGGRYGDTYAGSRRFHSDLSTYPFPIYGIEFRLYSPAELLVTAPDGSKTGLDPLTGERYAEIPESAYVEEGYDNVETGVVDPDKVKILSVSGGPADGEYELQVTGTDVGTYAVAIMRRNSSGQYQDTTEIPQSSIQPGVVHRYAIQYSTSGAQPVEVSGGYDGGGQRPRDVNKFLRYANPSQARTHLPAGTTSLRLSIYYGKTVYPGSFVATLNGSNVIDLFNPVAGGHEEVEIPLVPGSNTLILSIQGDNDSGRVSTDTDRMVFLVD